MRDKSFRRHERQKAVARVTKWMKANDPWWNHPEEREATLDRARKRADNPQSCSSYCCGNPRKWWKQVTHQETVANLRHRDEY